VLIHSISCAYVIDSKMFTISAFYSSSREIHPIYLKKHPTRFRPSPHLRSVLAPAIPEQRPRPGGEAAARLGFNEPTWLQLRLQTPAALYPLQDQQLKTLENERRIVDPLMWRMDDCGRAQVSGIRE